MDEFSVGDVVQLKSGGQSMTVSEIRSDGQVLAIWTDEVGALQELYAPGVCFFDPIA